MGKFYQIHRVMVCAKPSLIPRRPVFSRHGSFMRVHGAYQFLCHSERRSVWICLQSSAVALMLNRYCLRINQFHNLLFSPLELGIISPHSLPKTKKVSSADMCKKAFMSCYCGMIYVVCL